MIKLIIFDLDGVLVESREMHYQALNRALQEISPEHVISRKEHQSTFDGLSTTKKLELLSTRGLSVNLHDQIWNRKQYFTNQIINGEYQTDERICTILRILKEQGYLLYVASNSIHSTVKDVLLNKGFLKYIDYFASNQSVKHPKPNPEIYFHCMSRLGHTIDETLIIEDSPIGRQAALSSGAHLLQVENSAGVTLNTISTYIKSVDIVPKQIKWMGRCNVVIPMAGAGSRFAKVGFTDPKPLIDVFGKPMIEVVVRNLNFGLNTRFIFIVQQEHLERYKLRYLLNLIAPGCVIIPTDGLTEGAACSILLAKEYINNSECLFLANSDQFTEWSSNDFMYQMISDGVDGGIATFKSDWAGWSYAKTDDSGWVTKVREKKVISNHATVGYYFWKRGRDFVKYAEQMINKKIKVKNEYYVCPVYNEAIASGLKIKIFEIERMWGLGIPEDLKYFLENYTGKI